MGKTVVIWDSVGLEPICYFVVDRDVSHLNQKYVNDASLSDDVSTEVSNLMYDDAGKKIIDTTEEFPADAVRDGASVIVCGFLP